MTSGNNGMPHTRQSCYSDLINPSLKDAINHNCLSTIKLANLVADFAEEMARLHEQFSKQVQTIIASFRNRNVELKKDRYTDSPSTIYNAWECLMRETEVDSQAHMDAANLLMKNVFEPLKEVATHKNSQAERLQAFRDNFEEILQKSEKQFQDREQDYINSFNEYRNCGTVNNREGFRQDFHNAHNDYIFQIRSSNRIIDEFQIAIPQVLEELDEIYIDTSNTINVAIESHSLLLLTKANEQQRRFENLLKVCGQVNPQHDISCFVKGFKPEETVIEFHHHSFSPADLSISNSAEEAVMNRLIVDRFTEAALRDRRAALQREALELTSHIKQNQDVTHTLVNICQRNLANHLYAKVYETQEDMCRKRNEIRIANMQLGAVRSQIELLTPKQNGSVDDDQDKKNPSTIRGMWKKAFKSLKSSASEPKLLKKGSFYKKKQNSKEDDEPETVSSGAVDPVYSLLKCAQEMPKSSGGKSPCMVHPHCSGHHSGEQRYMRYPSGGDSSGNTSKTSSPSSSDMHDIVTDSLGSDFKNFYKLTSPAKKTSSPFDSILPL